MCRPEDLTGGTPEENAHITRAILSGEPAPKTDAVLLNSAAAIYVAREGVSMPDTLTLARDTISSGKALTQLESFIYLTNS